jgi:hypothetical protein
MRASRIIRAVNWRHAVGEVLLIVVGILIALAISDWNDRRLQRIQELALLEEIKSTMETDVAALETKLEEIKGAAEQLESLEELLNNPQPYEPDMDRLFGAAYGFRMANLSSASYETLKSEGLQSVTNRDLRAQIAHVFDHHYQLIEEWRDLEMDTTVTVLRPYYLQYFKNLRFHENATPIDYEFIVNDAYFQNLIHYRIANLEFNPMTSYPEAIADIRSAIRKIEEEIAR